MAGYVVALVYIAIFVLPATAATYILLKTLFRLIADLKYLPPRSASQLHPYSKIALTLMGLLYSFVGVFILGGLVLSMAEIGSGFRLPPWLPTWARLVLAVAVLLWIPYMAIVFGFMGGVRDICAAGGSATKMLRHIVSGISETTKSKKSED